MSIKATLPIGEEMQAATKVVLPAGAHARASEALGRREMNVAVLKTKAEQALTETFAAIADKLPGGAAVLKRREEAIGRFSALGLPHRRIEAWKYTDLRNLMKEALPPSLAVSVPVSAKQLDAALGPLAKLDAMRVVFVDGFYAEALSDTRSVPGLAVMSLGRALADEADATSDRLLEIDGIDNEPIVALNTAYVTDGAVIAIADKAKLEKPLLIVNVSASPEPRFVATRNVVAVGAHAHATIIEAFVALPGAATDAQASALTEIDLAKDAQATHVKCVLGTGGATHLANWLVGIGERADYRGFQFTSGVALARNQLALTFKGQGATIDLSGAFLARATSTSIRRSSSITRSRAAPAASCSRACSRTRRAASSRARSSCGRMRRRPTASRWRRCSCCRPMPSSIPSPSSRSLPTTWSADTARPAPTSTRICCSIAARAASRSRRRARC